ncbi:MULTISPECIES: 3-keto-5-aminohexanoate cleavage protein [Haloarcula]|uniref:3-keto-5-aminohexanoate cleavage protein n=1 Tax=Haloarcula pellucida TaxID=1427151 RepID=A0A830GID0_9EURY|nr:MULTISPECIES: 3-keto-5-aminohexanoate cleavage protein [Halomicroarcula]MBX0347349.1 3-keto-5-aminohexanoate cleavage protein [Halomicroarcula pellucida]MDS0276777.1 3-keto-5-aminohexanoate cleavage protein [Halomicroarcula sp. S1AR25-4]GGN88223.1 3-keto-5-aminohexanoate cleavage protein [Halomicroarcula pellucida]
MTYDDYIRGHETILGVAPTGYRYSTDVNDSLPVTPEDVAEQVYESASFGATLAHLHGRGADGDPAPSRLPAFGSAVRDLCQDDVLVEYAVEPACSAGDFLTIIDEGPAPDLASVRVGPAQYGYRDGSETSRRDVDRLVEELVKRDIRPNLLVTNGRDLQEVFRLLEQSALDDPPVLTLLFGAGDGTVATPMTVVSLLDAAPERATCLVRATGPNQYPLTAMAFFLGAHPVVGMEDNLFVAPETPVERNAQLVRQAAERARYSLRDVATPSAARRLLGLSSLETEDNDIEV